MNEDAKLACRQMLSNAEDNLFRANAAARRNSLDGEWGQSGKTLREIRDGYQSEVDRWRRALEAL